MRRIGLPAIWMSAFFSAAFAGRALAQPTLTGTVLAPGGRPAAEARVELLPVLPSFEQGRRRLEDSADPTPAAVARTDAAGRFTLRVPEIGVWKVAVRSPGAVPIQIAPLPVVEPVELPAAVLSADVGAPLRFLDPAGRPLAGAWVVASGPGEPVDGWRSESRLGRTDAQGALVLPRRDGEDLEISIFLPGRAEVVRCGVQGGTIQVSAQDAVGQTLRLATRDGEPVPGAVVRLGVRAWPFGRTDSEGRLRLPLAPGEATRLQWSAADGRQAVLQLAPSADGTERTLTPAEPLALSGRILESAGRKPIPGALVWTSLDPGAWVRADREGSFRIPAPGRRRFDLEAAAPGFLTKKVTLPALQIASGRGATLALVRSAAVRGQTVDPQGRPLSGSLVTAVAESLVGERFFAASDPVADRTFADAQGRFELRRLRPDESYVVRGSRPGSFPAELRVTASDPGAPPRRVTLVLAPARAGRGKVQDAAGRPIPDAEITVLPSLRPDPAKDPTPGDPLAGPGIVTVPSDARGLFLIPECPAAEVELRVRKKGYAAAFFPALRIAAGAGPADLGVVTLRPGATLAGRVVDDRGGPDRGIAGAEVFALDKSPAGLDPEAGLKGRKPAASTAADGRFAIEDLAQGAPVQLLVRAEGYLTAVVRGVRPAPALPAAPAAPAADTPPLRIRLEPEAALRGRVVDEADEPVPGARIELRWQAFLPEDPHVPVGRPVLRNTRTGADGRFELHGIPAEGKAHLAANATGFVPLEGFGVELPRPVAAGELRLVLQRGATVQGRVTTAAGEPVPATRVDVGGATAATDDEGFYWLEGAEPGRREALFLHPSYGRVVQPFEVQPGVNVLDVAFPPGVEVAGRVIDEHGKAVPGARVTLGARSALRQYQDVTGDDGRFRLAPVVDGRYRLKAEAAGLTESELPGEIEVAGDAVANLEIVLQRGAVLSGQILGLAPEDLAKVTVVALGDRGASVAAWTDGRGQYEIRPLRPGDWLVRAELRDGQRQVQVRVPIARDDREVTRDLDFAKRLTLSAQVLYDEEPLPDAKVALRGQRLAVERFVITDYEGRFRLDDLEPDIYRLGLSHPGKMLVHNDQIDLQQDRDVVIRLQASTVGGMVMSQTDREPVAGALLALRPVEGQEFLITAGTKADGRFGIYHVPPGRYRLQAQAEGFVPAEQEIQTAAGEALENLEFRLEPAAGAKLRVRLASGQVPEFVHLLVRSPAGGVVLAESRRADGSGLVELSTISPGSWELFARADGGALAAATLLVPSEPLALTLAPAGSLRVNVPALATSDRIAMLRILGPGQQPFWTLGTGGRVEQQWPLVGGRGIVEGLPAGTWLLQIETPDGQRWTGTATTPGSGEASVRIE